MAFEDRVQGAAQDLGAGALAGRRKRRTGCAGAALRRRCGDGFRMILENAAGARGGIVGAGGSEFFFEAVDVGGVDVAVAQNDVSREDEGPLDAGDVLLAGAVAGRRDNDRMCGRAFHTDDMAQAQAFVLVIVWPEAPCVRPRRSGSHRRAPASPFGR